MVEETIGGLYAEDGSVLVENSEIALAFCGIYVLEHDLPLNWQHATIMELKGKAGLTAGETYIHGY